MKGIKKNIILLGLMLIVGIVFLGCELEDDGSMKLGGNHNDVYNTKENINVKHTQSDSSNIVMMSVTSPASWTEEYKTFYRKVKKKELKKIDTTLKSTNTFWRYIKSKGFNISNVRILKSEEVVSMPWPKSKEEAVKKIFATASKVGKLYLTLGRWIYVDNKTNFYISSCGYDMPQSYRYYKKYNKNGKYLFSILYTTNTGPHYDKYYFALESIYVDKMEHLYCYGWVSAKIWGSSKGVKEYNKEGQLVKQGIVKKGYYINSKGEKMSETVLQGRGWREEYKVRWDFMGVGDKFYKKKQGYVYARGYQFDYEIKNKNYHSFLYDIYSGFWKNYYIDKYGTLYGVFSNQKRFISSDFPIPNTYGYILIVSPVEKGGRLLGVVALEEIDEYSGLAYSIDENYYISNSGEIYVLYTSKKGVLIKKICVYNE